MTPEQKQASFKAFRESKKIMTPAEFLIAMNLGSYELPLLDGVKCVHFYKNWSEIMETKDGEAWQYDTACFTTKRYAFLIDQELIEDDDLSKVEEARFKFAFDIE